MNVQFACGQLLPPAAVQLRRPAQPERISGRTTTCKLDTLSAISAMSRCEADPLDGPGGLLMSYRSQRICFKARIRTESRARLGSGSSVLTQDICKACLKMCYLLPLGEIDRHGASRVIAELLGLTRKDREVQFAVYRVNPGVRGRFLAGDRILCAAATRRAPQPLRPHARTNLCTRGPATGSEPHRGRRRRGHAASTEHKAAADGLVGLQSLSVVHALDVTWVATRHDRRQCAIPSGISCWTLPHRTALSSASMRAPPRSRTKRPAH